MRRAGYTAKKQRILEGATELIHEVGYDKADVRRICEYCGVSIGTIYHYYKDKQDLLNDILRDIDIYLTDVVQPTLNCDTQADNLRLFAKAFANDSIATVATYGSLISNTNVPLPSTQEDMAAEHMRSLYSIPEQIILKGIETKEFRSDISPAEMASYIVMSLRGCVMEWARRQYSYDLSQYISDFFELIIRGLGNE